MEEIRDDEPIEIYRPFSFQQVTVPLKVALDGNIDHYTLGVLVRILALLESKQDMNLVNGYGNETSMSKALAKLENMGIIERADNDR